jgi:CBS domain containing-hemolysin-like protein
VGVTGVLVIFGEILPKSVAVNSPRRYAMRMSGPLTRTRRLLRGPTQLFRRISRLVLEVLDRLVPGDRLDMQGDEMLGLLSLGEESGSFGARERQLAEGVFQLGDLPVEDVMTPRVDLFLLDATLTVGEAAAAMRRTGHSLAPVTGKTSDHVLGLVHALALLAESDAARPVSELAVPAEYCPETRKAGSLLMELLEKGAPLAVVLDEYGALAGLATLEDLFEVMVGDIRDSHDTESLRYHMPTPDTLIASSRLPAERVRELLGVTLSSGSAETLGGHLMEVLGEVPETGTPYVVDGLLWTVLSARGPALGTLRLERRP